MIERRLARSGFSTTCLFNNNNNYDNLYGVITAVARIQRNESPSAAIARRLWSSSVK